jgi:hypothetical protein
MERLLAETVEVVQLLLGRVVRRRHGAGH